MRYPGWLLLFAGVLIAPQAALSAGAWGEQMPAGGWQRPNAYLAPMPSQFRPAQPMHAPAATRFADQRARLQAAGYRFRPWQGPVDTQRVLRRPYPRQAVVAGYPTQQPAWRPTVTTPADHRPSRPMAARTPQWYPMAPAHHPAEWTAPAPSPYSHAGYRFRPHEHQQARVQSAPRYRPVQVQIPDRYVFRPLNPVARPAPQRPVAPPMPVNAAYRLPGSGYPTPDFAAYYPPRHPDMIPYQAFRYAGPQGFNPMPGYPEPRRFAAYPARPAFPLAHAPGMRPMPQFRPRPGPEMAGPAQMRHPLPVRRHARQPRYAPGPAYAWRPDRPYPAVVQAPQARPSGGMHTPPMRSNRYGMDWYDGRGDGVGAWYSLTLKSEPVISQTQEPRAVAPYDQTN